MSDKEAFQILLGQNVRRIRIDRNYTVEDLGFESGLGYSQVSRIELGKRNPTAYTLYVLSKALKVCPSEFFTTKPGDINHTK
jgi:transcriptional regulator with XRE-family HTH domain